MTKDEFRNIIGTVRELISGTEWEGHVFAVGGCCRDELLGLSIKDVDMVVDLPDGGIRFADWLVANDHTAGNSVVYETYGTAMFRLKDFPDDELECVMTRKEKYPDRTSRNPVTVFGTLEEDCLRRDLTINALYIDVSSGSLLDMTGLGVDDIRNHVIRTPSDPDITYDDDPLRILRCVRFASRFGWEISAETYLGMIRNVSRLSIITSERIREELFKMLTGPRPVMAMDLLRNTGAMHYVIPEFDASFDMTQNEYHSGTVWEHTLAVLGGVAGSDLEICLAALLHDIGKTVTRTESVGKIHFLEHETAGARIAETIMRRLHCSNEFIKQVLFLIRHHMDVKPYGSLAEKLKPKRLRRLMYLCETEECFRDLMSLIDADNKAHSEAHAMPMQVTEIIRKMEAMKAEGSAMFGYKLPLSGKDIMEIKGIKPGPAVKLCNEYLLKLAFVNPLRPKDEFIKHLKGFELKTL